MSYYQNRLENIIKIHYFIYFPKTPDLLAEFQLEHKNFLGYRRIYYSKRSDTDKEIERDLERVRHGVLHHPGHVLGYDLVGDEDFGVTLNHHLKAFLKHSTIQIDSNGKERLKSSIPLYLHTAETNWNEQFHIENISSKDDLTPRTDNLYSAVILGAKRIGHGLGFWKHPYLMEILKENKIPIEVCVVSNKLLGYTYDLREHPGQLFHKQGIPVVLSPDDPGLFGYNEVTLDWFHVFMAWGGLNIGDLYQFGLNSLVYSAMNEAEKSHAIGDVFDPAWRKYVGALAREACEMANEDLSSQDARIEKVFPEFVKDSSTFVHVFAFDIHQAMCGVVRCSYRVVECEGVDVVDVVDVVMNGSYVSNQHLVCSTPPIHQLLAFESQQEFENEVIKYGLRQRHSHQHYSPHHNNHNNSHHNNRKNSHYNKLHSSCKVRLNVGYENLCNNRQACKTEWMHASKHIHFYIHKNNSIKKSPLSSHSPPSSQHFHHLFFIFLFSFLFS